MDPNDVKKISALSSAAAGAAAAGVPGVLGISPLVVSVLNEWMGEHLAETLEAREAVDQLASQVVETEAKALLGEDHLDGSPETVASQSDLLREQVRLHRELLQALANEREANQSLLQALSKLVEGQAAQQAEDQVAMVRAERRAKIGTAVGVVGVLVAVGSLVVSVLAL